MSIWIDRGVLIYCCVMAFALGAVFGSFLNCAAWRIAHGESFLRGDMRWGCLTLSRFSAGFSSVAAAATAG